MSEDASVQEKVASLVEESMRALTADVLPLQPMGSSLHSSSSLETMIKYVEDVLDPYLKVLREALGKTKHFVSRKSVLNLDSWSVHRGPFLRWLQENRKHIIPLFIPAGCTSVFQPADIGLNKPYKSSMRNCFHLWYMEEMYKWMQAGSNVVDFALDQKIAAIRDQSAMWMIAAWKDLAVKHDLIKNAWQNQARLLDAWQPSVQNVAERRRAELFDGDVEHDVEEEANDTPEPEEDENGQRFADRLLELQSAETVANLQQQAADVQPLSIEMLLDQLNANWCDSHAALEAESAEERERNA